MHPYYENGTITSFNIILKNTKTYANSEDGTYIQEVYKVENKSYSSNYTYQVIEKNIWCAFLEKLYCS